MKRLTIQQARMRAAKHTFLLTTCDDEWTPEKEQNLVLNVLYDINAIIAGDNDIKHWRRVKQQFVDGIAMAQKTEQKAELIREIVGGNRAFQIAFNYWDAKHELLMPNLRAAQAALETVLEIRKHFTPRENFMAREQLNLTPKVADQIEHYMDDKAWTGAKEEV